MKITGAHLPNLGYQEFDTGHGKLSAQLDLREQRDVDTLRGLVREADVFSQGYRPGTLGNRGLSPEELAAIRPGLVYVSLCAFSHAGPWASRRGFDTVVQTVSGITSRQAEIVPGKTPGPQFYPVSAIDYCTGYLMAFGAMVALKRRATRGRQLAGAHLAGADRQVDRRSGRSAGERRARCARRVHPGRTRTLVDGVRNAVRQAAPPEAGRANVGNPDVLGAAVGAAGLSPAGLAARAAHRHRTTRAQRRTELARCPGRGCSGPAHRSGHAAERRSRRSIPRADRAHRGAAARRAAGADRGVPVRAAADHAADGDPADAGLSAAPSMGRV